MALDCPRGTNVQGWPQDPYFPFSFLVPHFSEVWKCGISQHVSPSHEPLVIVYLVLRKGEKSDKVRMMSHFSPSHEPLVILYLVLHFSEVRKGEKSDKVRVMSRFSPSHEPFVILYLVLHFSEVRKYGIV